MHTSSKAGTELMKFYKALHEAYGPQGWWPGDTPTEIAIGAILVQNTNWQNVEKAIARLRDAGMLNWQALYKVRMGELAELIRPAGYYQVKARRLKNLVTWLCEQHGGDLENLRALPLAELREQLLAVNGIGPETADSILLYALDRPTFVVDTYTARVTRRHGLIDGEADYYQLKSLFEDNLPDDVGLFNEYHALLVAVGKRHCRPTARCSGCPLEAFEHDVESR
ncbi:MAG TPA: endonuclease III domain-containing protein [Phycisphaerae bacterium]|nr:endonuclease III domain-containing protein [Phycisphaerae bacterium]